MIHPPKKITRTKSNIKNKKFVSFGTKYFTGKTSDNNEFIINHRLKIFTTRIHVLFKQKYVVIKYENYSDKNIFLFILKRS